MGNLSDCCGGADAGSNQKKIMTQRRRVVLTDGEFGNTNTATAGGTRGAGDSSETTSLVNPSGTNMAPSPKDPYHKWYSSLESSDALITNAGNLPAIGAAPSASTASSAMATKPATATETTATAAATESSHSGSEPTKLRSFVIVRHSKYGLLLLKAMKRRKGGLHWQLPGGRVNSDELRRSGITTITMKKAALRELAEETGINATPSQLTKLDFRRKNRTYFLLDIDDDICLRRKGELDGSLLTQSESGEDFFLRLSSEHVGFCFEKNLKKAGKLVESHSAGESTVAVLMFAREFGD